MDYQQLFNAISLQLLVFTTCSGVVFLLSQIAVRFSPSLTQWSSYWLFTYLLTFLPFLPIAFFSFEYSNFYVLKDLITLNQDHLTIHATTANFMPKDDFGVSGFIKILLALVLFSTLRALVIFSLNTHRVGRLIKNAEPVSFIDGMSANQQSEIASRNINLMLSPETPPFAYGFYSRYILLPNSIEVMMPEHKQMLIEHELQHHRKNDTRKVILLRLLTGVFWFNPFLHYLEKRFIIAMEINCDAAVVSSLKVQASVYANALISCLKICKNLNHSQLTAYFSSPNSVKAALEIRLKKVMTKTPKVNLAEYGQLFAFSLMSLLIAMLIKSALYRGSYSHGSEGQMPISNGVISFDYSESKEAPHFGIDIQAVQGTMVSASFTGRVVIADNFSLDKGFGLTVLIEHKDNTTSLYANLQHTFVDVGQIVKAGELIGTLGSKLGQDTDNVITPHLHFEMSKSGLHLNPNHFLNNKVN